MMMMANMVSKCKNNTSNTPINHMAFKIHFGYNSNVKCEICFFSFFLFFPFSHAFVFNATLQNFINKYIVDLENAQRNKKKEKGEFTR
jgi:hypothetical protein